MPKRRMANALSIVLPFHTRQSHLRGHVMGTYEMFIHDVNMKNGIKVMVLGKHLPAFSKSILRDGQFYYL
jgi:hypothetical protein